MGKENGKMYEWDSSRLPKVIFDINTLPGAGFPLLSFSQFFISIGKSFYFFSNYYYYYYYYYCLIVLIINFNIVIFFIIICFSIY